MPSTHQVVAFGAAFVAGVIDVPRVGGGPTPTQLSACTAFPDKSVELLKAPARGRGSTVRPYRRVSAGNGRIRRSAARGTPPGINIALVRGMTAPSSASHLIMNRVRGEFLEMPGLRLRLEQAQRLWGLDRRTCEDLLTSLVDAKFLARRPNDVYGLA